MQSHAQPSLGCVMSSRLQEGELGGTISSVIFQDVENRASIKYSTVLPLQALHPLSPHPILSPEKGKE